MKIQTSGNLNFSQILKRELDERVTATQIQFSGDVVAVIINRPCADSKLGGNLAARFMVGNQPQNLALGGGQRAESFNRSRVSAARLKR